MRKKIVRACFQCVVWMIRGLLALRYRIEVRGLENLRVKKGIVFLPNHPAEIDPVIITTLLWMKFHPSPLVIDRFFYHKVYRYFMRIANALALPSMEGPSNSWKRNQITKLLDSISHGLKRGQNYLIYPAGRLKESGDEILGGASFVPNLLKAHPDTNVVLVRMTGLWGSRFSKALTGKSPSFGAALFEGFKILLKNGIFFTPKRKVLIEIEKAPSNLPVHKDRWTFNESLEDWYNISGPEPLTLVSSVFWKREVPSVEKRHKPTFNFKISTDLEKEIIGELARITHRPEKEITRQMHLSFDLGLDSLDVAQLYTFLEEPLTYGDLQTVEDVLRAAAGTEEKQEQKAELPKKNWQEHNRLAPFQPIGNTIPEAFLWACERMGNSVACADKSSGALSYNKLKMAALILAKKFKEYPEKYIGILLPSSVAVNMVVLACLIAKKTPVMLNWTVGVRALNHAMKLTHLKTVITSYRFLDRLDNVELGHLEDCFLFLEDVKNSLSWKDKIAGLYQSLLPVKFLISKWHLHKLQGDHQAVILFSSGTESLPKAVPLTHKNLLSNQRAALSVVDMGPKDIFYGVLPPFHSFGFSVTGLLPLLSGIKAFYAPDPTDSRSIAADIAMFKPTVFCSAPSFIRGIFKVAKPGQLRSVRLFVSGAEKAPQELFKQVEQLHSQLIEGYGITECGPIVTLVRPKESAKGVGLPLPTVSLCVVDDETLVPIPVGKEGEICIVGPSVFHGYLGHPRSAFLKIHGKRWYRSGDRGFLDKEGNLHLTGRLKRFAKIGGEMVSLTGLEEELSHLAQRKKWVKTKKESPVLAVSVKEAGAEKTQIYLYTTFPLTVKEVNATLKESGYGRIIKIAEIKQISEIPTGATGKIQYRVLDEM